MIDAHVHLWQLGRHGCVWPTAALPAIHRDSTMNDWRAEADEAGVTGAVLVQSQEDAADTAWLLETASAEPSVLAVVGWIDLLAADAPATIAALARHPKLRGLRPMVQDREDDWYDQPALEPAWDAMAAAGLALDALVRPRHLASLARLAARRPSLRVVIDHGAKPRLNDLGEWIAALRSLAAHPQVRCKLSGLLTERLPGEAADAIEPAAAVLLDLFGPNRLLWGSDWPVLRLAGSYRGWLDQARALVPAAWADDVFDGAARAAYGIAA